MTLLEFDLDELARRGPGRRGSGLPGSGLPGDPSRPAPRSGRGVAILAGALVLAAIGGAVLRSVSSGAGPVPAAPVTARLTVQGLALAPDPMMALRLELSAPAAGVEVDRIDLNGGGVDRVSLPLDASLASAGSLGFDLAAPLRCSGLGEPDLTGTVRLRDQAAAGWREVSVVVAGALNADGGGCALTRAGLPDGWQAPVRVDGVQVQQGSLVITVAELGAGRTVAGVFADGTLLSRAPGTGPVGRLALQPPVSDCRAQASRPAVPTGLRLLVSGRPEGLVSRYAAVGPALAGWLRSSYTAQCGRPPGRG